MGKTRQNLLSHAHVLIAFVWPVIRSFQCLTQTLKFTSSLLQPLLIPDARILPLVSETVCPVANRRYDMTTQSCQARCFWVIQGVLFVLSCREIQRSFRTLFIVMVIEIGGRDIRMVFRIRIANTLGGDLDNILSSPDRVQPAFLHPWP